LNVVEKRIIPVLTRNVTLFSLFSTPQPSYCTDWRNISLSSGYNFHSLGVQQLNKRDSYCLLTVKVSGFGGLEVACWPLVPKFAGSHPAEAAGFLGQKYPQHAFLRKGSKAIGPMS
jgi:hypothetical protein